LPGLRCSGTQIDAAELTVRVARGAAETADAVKRQWAIRCRCR
jgi:hypothetical protein